MKIVKGSTYRDVLMWAEDGCTFANITGVSLTAPCVVTAPAHGIPSPGWHVAIANVKGTTQINAEDNPPKDSQYVWAEVIDANSIRIPCLDATGFKAYVSGGTLRYRTPMDLAGFTARQHIRDKAGNLLMELTTEALAGSPRIILDNVAKTITREIPADVTAAIEWKTGTYDLEMVLGTDVSKIDSGAATVAGEQTR